MYAYRYCHCSHKYTKGAYIQVKEPCIRKQPYFSSHPHTVLTWRAGAAAAGAGVRCDGVVTGCASLLAPHPMTIYSIYLFLERKTEK